MSTKPRSVRPARRPLAIPFAIAAVSAVGLLAALLGDGLLNLVSWLALALPLAIIVWAWMAKRQAR